MKRTQLIILLLLFPSIFSCRKQSLNCEKECSYEEELLFNYGFEGVTLTQDENKATISGTDYGYPDNNEWSKYTANPNGIINIEYEDGNISQRIAELAVDPNDSSNQVLHYKIISPNVFDEKGKEKKARIQTKFFNSECIREYYQKVDIYLPQDMEHLEQYPESIYWLSIFEFWNNANWTGEKYPFRITVGFHKEEGVGSKLHFNVEAQTFKRPNNFKNVWSETAVSFDLVYGEWFTLELYVLEGDENEGKFEMSVIPDGGSKTELFNITNTTQHPKEKCADGFAHIHPLKWYTSKELVNYMKDDGKGLEIYWDNWEVWKNKKP